jgi:hypothetical protein
MFFYVNTRNAKVIKTTPCITHIMTWRFALVIIIIMPYYHHGRPHLTHQRFQSCLPFTISTFMTEIKVSLPPNMSEIWPGPLTALNAVNRGPQLKLSVWHCRQLQQPVLHVDSKGNPTCSPGQVYHPYLTLPSWVWQPRSELTVGGALAAPWTGLPATHLTLVVPTDKGHARQIPFLLA